MNTVNVIKFLLVEYHLFHSLQFYYIHIPGVTSTHAEDVLQEKLNVALKRNEHLTEVGIFMCHSCIADVLKFQIKLARQKGLDKQCRP